MGESTLQDIYGITNLAEYGVDATLSIEKLENIDTDRLDSLGYTKLEVDDNSLVYVLISDTLCEYVDCGQGLRMAITTRNSIYNIALAPVYARTTWRDYSAELRNQIDALKQTIDGLSETCGNLTDKLNEVVRHYTDRINTCSKIVGKYYILSIKETDPIKKQYYDELWRKYNGKGIVLKQQLAIAKGSLNAVAKLASKCLSLYGLVDHAQGLYNDILEYGVLLNSVPNCECYPYLSEDLFNRIQLVAIGRGAQHVFNIGSDVAAIHAAWMSMASAPATGGASLAVTAGTIVFSIAKMLANIALDAFSSNMKKKFWDEINALARNESCFECSDDDNGNNGSGDDDGGENGHGDGSEGGEHDSGNQDSEFDLDPSGYVYEGVSSNRVEGVMASCYYKETVEDMYGDLHENVVLWDAEKHAQENPLFTDENGMYRWDVPQGLWQVKFEKEGYETTYSDWLPVPPPQLEVNIAMTQNKQPEVKAARAYEDGIEVEFDKYMQLDGLTTENIYITKNGEAAAGTVKLLNEEQAYENNPVKYASKVRFVPETSFLTTDEVTLTVNRKVKSYAGAQMENDYIQTFDIEKEVKSIIADSVIRVAYDGNKEIQISALPYDAAIGKQLVVTNSSSMITSISADTLTFDENGQASLTLNGDLPGTAMLTFTLAETDVKALSTVKVVIPEQLTVVAPKASRVSGTALYRGTAIRLTSETKDAVIYYTLDGSCPCDENAPRFIYEYPIVFTDDVTIKAMAMVDGQEASEVTEFSYTVKRTNLGLELKEGWNWVSHNMESEMPTSVLPQNATRIVGQTAELVNDTKLGLVGNLESLHPDEAYKVQMPRDSVHLMSGCEFNPAQYISLTNGWNWLGYPMSQTMSLGEAFANMQPDEEDYIVGQDGFAQYADGVWTGTLQTLNPGMGYMYHSQSSKSFVYNANIVSKAKSLYGKGLPNLTPWAADKHKYPNIMCLVAQVYDNGQVSTDYLVGAFCGTECRGVGKYVNGKLMMNIYGDKNEEIVFRAVHAETEEAFEIAGTIRFKETLLGSASQPYALHIGEATALSDVYSGWGIRMDGGNLYLELNGKPFDYVSLTDSYGTLHLTKKSVAEHEPVDVSALPSGVYVVVAAQGNNMYYKKILKADK